MEIWFSDQLQDIIYNSGLILLYLSWSFHI